MAVMGAPLDDVRYSNEADGEDASRMVVIQDHTSDGAMYVGPTARKSKDQESADETASSATDHSYSPELPSAKLTKTQRKKQGEPR
jgi:hypothetical protein